ncbi:ATP-binding protein [Agromyces mediolanus]|uniref:ATP-binding protein n=1 Tax=Agromyces mediolanus TaxID=41986 RepID=UPI00203C1B56|nr:ATP-binding protein [Agromyces mediolanus]MCM3659094.1 ATP-binding protein [Agromyces mediolanus]
MDSVSNPYTPNAGAAPEVMVGRDEQLEAFRVLLQRLERHRTEQSMIITGLRGVGKTVLLGRFGELARAAHWEVVEFEASRHDEARFRQLLFSQLKSTLLRLSPRARWTECDRRAAEVLSAFALPMVKPGAFGLSWDVVPAEGAGDHGDLGMDLTDVLLAFGEAADERGHGIALLVDEVQFLARTQLEALIQAVHKTVQRKLPVAFVGAGLPQTVELAGDVKAYAERLFSFSHLGVLTRDDARRALTEPARLEGVEFDDDALELALELTHGYPCFLQELGAQVWSLAEAPRVRRVDVALAREAYEARLDGTFFRVRLDRITPLQTAYLRAMAELGPEPQKAGDVARVMHRESTQVGPTRAELIDLGLLYTPEHGYAAFTAPDFDAFLKRAIPELVVPEVQRRPRKPD